MSSVNDNHNDIEKKEEVNATTERLFVPISYTSSQRNEKRNGRLLGNQMVKRNYLSIIEEEVGKILSNKKKKGNLKDPSDYEEEDGKEISKTIGKAKDSDDITVNMMEGKQKNPYDYEEDGMENDTTTDFIKEKLKDNSENEEEDGNEVSNKKKGPPMPSINYDVTIDLTRNDIREHTTDYNDFITWGQDYRMGTCLLKLCFVTMEQPLLNHLGWCHYCNENMHNYEM